MLLTVDVEGTTEGEEDVVVSVAMVDQEDRAETTLTVKETRPKMKAPQKRKMISSVNRVSRVGKEAEEVAVDSVVVDAIVIIVAEVEGGDHALTPKVKILEREKVSKMSNVKVEIKSVVVVVDQVGVVEGVADEAEGDSLVVSTAEGLLEDVLQARTMKVAVNKRGVKTVKIASPSPMRALRKQHL